MTQNCWDESWDFQHFSWEIQRLGSSNTGNWISNFDTLTVQILGPGEERERGNIKYGKDFETPKNRLIERYMTSVRAV